MSTKIKNGDLSHDTRSNFGAKGWGVIIFSALNFYFFGGLTATANNIVVPLMAGKLGMNPGNLLSLSTPAGIVAIIVSLIAGNLVRKIGLKVVNGVALLIGALAVFLWGTAATFPVYAVAVFGVVCALSVVQLCGGNMAITNWFPKKKGIAIGWATMGLNLNGATVATILVALIGALGGVMHAMWVVAAALVVLAIINFAFFRNYPEECGAFPDNNPDSVRKDSSTLQTGWTIKKALRDRDVWLMSFANGILAMVPIGAVTTLIPSMISKGFSQPEALTMMTIVSVIGFAGSYFFGWFDQKAGVKKSAILCCVFMLISAMFFILPGKVCAWIYLLFIGLVMGGSNNFPPSMTAQIFGRDGSVVVYPLVHAIVGILRVAPFAILGQSLAITGSYNSGWIVFGISTVIGIVLLAVTNTGLKRDPAGE